MKTILELVQKVVDQIYVDANKKAPSYLQEVHSESVDGIVAQVKIQRNNEKFFEFANRYGSTPVILPKSLELIDKKS